MIVRSEFRDLETPTGPMRTHAYTPVHPTVAKKYPGLLLYSEIFQQTAPIARLCVQLASHGYVVMSPEIYHEHEPLGTVLGYDDDGKDKGNRYKHATKLSTFDADAKVVVAALRAHPACGGRIRDGGVLYRRTPRRPRRPPAGHPGLRLVLPDRSPYGHPGRGEATRTRWPGSARRRRSWS